MRTDYLNSIEIADLSSDLRLLAGEIGIEAVRGILKHFSGIRLHIPQPNRLHRAVRRYIQANYRVDEDGNSNICQLSLDTGLSIAIVRQHARATQRI